MLTYLSSLSHPLANCYISTDPHSWTGRTFSSWMFNISWQLVHRVRGISASQCEHCHFWHRRHRRTVYWSRNFSTLTIWALTAGGQDDFNHVQMWWSHLSQADVPSPQSCENKTNKKCLWIISLSNAIWAPVWRTVAPRGSPMVANCSVSPLENRTNIGLTYTLTSIR